MLVNPHLIVCDAVLLVLPLLWIGAEPRVRVRPIALGGAGAVIVLFASFLAYFTGNVTIGLIAMVVSVFALLRVCHFDDSRRPLRDRQLRRAVRSDGTRDRRAGVVVHHAIRASRRSETGCSGHDGCSGLTRHRLGAIFARCSHSTDVCARYCV